MLDIKLDIPSVFMVGENELVRNCLVVERFPYGSKFEGFECLLKGDEGEKLRLLVLLTPLNPLM